MLNDWDPRHPRDAPIVPCPTIPIFEALRMIDPVRRVRRSAEADTAVACVGRTTEQRDTCA